MACIEQLGEERLERWSHALHEKYEARLSRGRGAADSVRAASLAVLKERRAHEESDSPYWWGAFVASGR